MDKERYIFEKFRSKLNGDDCAVIGERAYCKDLFVEGVHFRRGWLSLREIGAKAMLVNISDMIATNARAKYALLGLALPREIGTREIDELCAGVSETAREWGIRIIGGDTIGSDRIALSVSLIGKCKCPVFRSGARVGDLIAHTGELGSVGRDLAVLLRDEISPASSQTQNRNDKISSLQGLSTAPQGLNAEASAAQNPGDEVRSPGDKISPTHAKLQSLGAETLVMQILDLEPQSLDDKISPARAEPQSLDAEISAQNSVSQSRDDHKSPTAQDSGLQSGGYDDSAGKISTQFDNEISTKSFDGKISAPSPDDENSTQDLNAYTACSVSQGSITQNLDTHASYDGLQGSAAQNQDAEFFKQNFTTQNLNVGNSTGNFMTQNSSAGNFTEASAMKLAAESSAEPSSSKTASENSVTPLHMKFAEDISAQAAVKFGEEKSACEIRGALAVGNFDSDVECAKSAAGNSSAETSCVDFERKNSTAASEGAQDLRQNFAAKLSVQGSSERSRASEILKCENAAAEVLALKDDMSESLASANFMPEKEPSVKLAPKNPALENFTPQTDALANPVLQNDTSAANSTLKNGAPASPASENLALRDDLSANSAVENSAPQSPVVPTLQNFTCETSAIQNAAQQEDMSAESASQNSACENSAPQSQAYEGSVFDLREDLRAKISKNSRFVRPVLRDKFFYKAAKFISAAMDISDGLVQDLPRLLEASGVGARWIARPSEAALQSGEEYEILFSFAPKFLPKIYAIAAKTGVSINIIAEVCPRTPQSSMEFRGSSHHFAP